MSSARDAASSPPEHAPSRQQYEMLQISEALRGLRFGSVLITVQDGVVVQIERSEKRRVARPTKVNSDNNALES